MNDIPQQPQAPGHPGSSQGQGPTQTAAPQPGPQGQAQAQGMPDPGFGNAFGQGMGMGQGGQPSMGPGVHGAAAGMHHAWGGPQAAYGYPPYAGYYAAPPLGWPPYPPDVAASQPGTAPAGFSSAMNDIAEQSGLGMFKDFLNLDDGEFWKGALVGAAVVLLATNEDLRSALIGGAAKTAQAVKSGFGGLAGSAADESQDSASDAVEQSDQENPQ